MRVIAGKHRRRRLDAPSGRALRPTADRVREALFDILAHRGFGPGGSSPIADARVIDAFAGTGAMGIEALSRGAAHVTFMDTDAAALAACRANLARLAEQPNATVLGTDAVFPPRTSLACSLAFLDPPYRSGLAAPALAALDRAGWFSADAIVTVELAADEPFALPAGFVQIDQRRYGATQVVFLRKQGSSEPD